MTKILHLILIIISIINILIIKFKNIKRLNYFIFISKTNKIDKRSLYFINKKILDKSFNLVRTQTNIDLKIFFEIIKIPNLFCYTLLKRIFIQDYKNKKFIYFLLKIFKSLHIEKIILIDDYREMRVFSEISKKLNIKSTIYMHGRISKNMKILKTTKFSNYLVWSNFFYKQLKQANNKYNRNNVYIVGNPYFKKKILRKKYYISVKNCLFLDEDFLSLRDIEICLKSIIKIKNLSVFYKKKVTRNLPEDLALFLNKNGIKILDHTESFANTIFKYKIDCVIATTSTGLLEALYYNVIPFKFYSSKKNIRELWFKEFVDRNLVNVLNFKKMKELFKKKYSLKKLINKKNLLWGKIIFKPNKVQKLIDNL